MPQVNVRLPDDTVAYLDSMAKTTGLSRSDVMRMALNYFAKAVPIDSDPRLLLDPPAVQPRSPQAPMRPATRYQRDPGDCSHRFRSPSGLCPACGDQK